MDLYQANILDHYKHPRQQGKLKNPTARSEHVNPLCGDGLEIELVVEKGKVVEAGFVGEGCVLSQAGASILLEQVIEKSVEELKKWDKQKMLMFLNIEVGPNRLKCALLSLECLQQALNIEK
ncbi:MAG: iron-sulfur cluster assembly scaffold protein [Patescibacteria group bacterium]